MIIPLKPFEIKFIFSPNLCHLIGNGHCCVIASCVCACVCASHQGTFPFLSTSLGLISKSPFYTFPLSLWLLHAPWTLTTPTNTVSKNLCRKRSYWAQQTDLCHSDEVGDDGCSLRGGWLAEHHELDPLGDAVEKGDEAFQDGVIHCAAVHHKAVVVLKLKEGRSIGYFIFHII